MGGWGARRGGGTDPPAVPVAGGVAASAGKAKSASGSRDGARVNGGEGRAEPRGGVPEGSTPGGDHEGVCGAGTLGYVASCGMGGRSVSCTLAWQSEGAGPGWSVSTGAMRSFEGGGCACGKEENAHGGSAHLLRPLRGDEGRVVLVMVARSPIRLVWRGCRCMGLIHRGLLLLLQLLLLPLLLLLHCIDARGKGFRINQHLVDVSEQNVVHAFPPLHVVGLACTSGAPRLLVTHPRPYKLIQNSAERLDRPCLRSPSSQRQCQRAYAFMHLIFALGNLDLGMRRP